MKNKKEDDELYINIRQIIDSALNYSYKAVNFSIVQAYWNIGRIIFEKEQDGKDRANYGQHLIEGLSNILTKDYGKGYDERNLRNMRAFYIAFPIRNALRSEFNQDIVLEKNLNAHTIINTKRQDENNDKTQNWNALSTESINTEKSNAMRSQLNFIVNPLLKKELSWTHYRLLMRVENMEAREFYIKEIIENNWSTRQLERQIHSFYYERLLASQDKNLVKQEAEDTGKNLRNEDFIKNPYILEFLNLKPNTSFLEKDLEKALIDKLHDFMLELGRGFAFVERQQRISTENDNFYIDLVFYNYILKCFILIDLKVGRLTHQDIGQMDMYVRMYEDLKRGKDDNPTIGIILCSEKSETVVKYSVLKDNQQLFASKYMLFLPTEDELKAEINREMDNIRIEKELSENGF